MDDVTAGIIRAAVSFGVAPGSTVATRHVAKLLDAHDHHRAESTWRQGEIERERGLRIEAERELAWAGISLDEHPEAPAHERSAKPIADMTAAEMARTFTLADGVLMSVVDEITVLAVGYSRDMTRATGRVAWLRKMAFGGWWGWRRYLTARDEVAGQQETPSTANHADLCALAAWLRGES